MPTTRTVTETLIDYVFQSLTEVCEPVAWCSMAYGKSVGLLLIQNLKGKDDREISI